MGHTYLGTLGTSKKWHTITETISSGADAATVASVTDEAADKALSIVQDDHGYKDAVYYMVQLGIAASQANPVRALAQIGVNIPHDATIVDVTLALSDALDERAKDYKHTSDFGPMAQQALTSTLSTHLDEKTSSLFEPSPKDVSAALKSLSNPSEFGIFARQFYCVLTDKYLGYFVEKALGSQVGEGQRFTTVNQMRQFQKELRTHCNEAAEIVRQFSADWFSKNRYEGSGDITKATCDNYGQYALTHKMRSELKARSGNNEK